MQKSVEEWNEKHFEIKGIISELITVKFLAKKVKELELMALN